MNPTIIAFYLPQYHPIKENNEWYGDGFTEWTNVGKAKPLFKGHYQPRVPRDLGYYDLRVPETRQAQADLAKEAGVDAFCYYHYWFSQNNIIMEYPLQEILRLHEPDFPFCLCWANHDWYNKEWDPSVNTLRQKPLMLMDYSDPENIRRMFYHYLPAFSDPRYFKIDGKLVYVILNVHKIPYWERLKKEWNSLAKENGIPEFFFIAYTTNISNFDNEAFKLADATILDLIRNIELKQNFSRRHLLFNYYRNMVGKWLGRPQYVYKYKDAIKYFLDDSCKDEDKIPILVPNWDWSPRRAAGGLILHNSTPELFKIHVEQAFELIKDKKENRQILFIKSWNEWGEGNYMEPDLRFGKGYIKALRSVVETYKNNNK